MSSAAEVGESPAPPKLCDYAVEVTLERLGRMLSHIEGVRKGDAPGPVHQMRVWSRRTRAALEIFHVCFDTKAFAEVERAVKSATDALSEARDLDVMIENLKSRAEKLPASHRTGIESFVERLQEQRDGLQTAVATAVTDLESRDLGQHFRDLAQKAAEQRTAAELEANSLVKPKAKRPRKGTR